MVRPSTDEAAASLAHTEVRTGYVESMLTQYKLQLCTFPTHTCTQHGRDNKGWTDSMQQQTSYLFVPRHGGSSEPALPPTEVVDRCRKRRGSATQVTRNVQKLISVWKDRSSHGSLSCINQVLLWLKPKEDKESGIKQRTLDTQEPNT